MKGKDSLPREPRYTITSSGRRAIEDADRCVCEIHLTGILLACAECGTVYGAARDMKRPRATRWTNGRGA